MAYTIEINRRITSPYSESGEWLDGDVRVISEQPTDTESYDPEWDYDNEGHVWWAIHRLRPMESFESGMYPIPDEVREHAWLLGCYEHPYKSDHHETTVRLTGDWTPAERSDVFREVCK